MAAWRQRWSAVLQERLYVRREKYLFRFSRGGRKKGLILIVIRTVHVQSSRISIQQQQTLPLCIAYVSLGFFANSLVLILSIPSDKRSDSNYTIIVLYNNI